MEQYVVLKVSNTFDMNVSMAQWLSWLERRPVTAEVTGSSPVWVVHTKHERPVVQELQSVSKIMGS